MGSIGLTTTRAQEFRLSGCYAPCYSTVSARSRLIVMTFRQLINQSPTFDRTSPKNPLLILATQYWYPRQAVLSIQHIHINHRKSLQNNGRHFSLINPGLLGFFLIFYWNTVAFSSSVSKSHHSQLSKMTPSRSLSVFHISPNTYFTSENTRSL